MRPRVMTAPMAIVKIRQMRVAKLTAAGVLVMLTFTLFVRDDLINGLMAVGVKE
jgi:hypothetical protein